MTYQLSITTTRGFDEPVHLTLTAGTWLYSTTHDLGTVSPPYPGTLEYPFIVPDMLPRA